MANLATTTDTDAQLSIYDAPREILTRANAAENATAGEIAKFACPRCGADAVERFYGPCSRCRAELRGESPPAPPAAPHRAPERPWRVLGAGDAAGVAHLGELAERYRGVDAVWLLPAALAELGLPAELENPRHQSHELVELARADGWGTVDGLRPTMALWRGPVRVDVVVPSWDRSSPWRDVAGAELDAALERFWRLVGVPWGYSGAVTSDALLRELTSRRRGNRIRPAVVPAPALPTRRGDRVELESDFVWARPPLADELSAPFAHAFDVNGAYLGAASSLGLPAGEPEHHATALSIDAKAVGLWRISPPSAGAWPDPFRPQPPRRGHEPTVWVTTPTAALAGELGIVAHEAFIWPEHHRYLDGWYRALRDARTELMGSTSSADAIALAAVKATYKQGIGRLGSSRRTRAADDVLYQPLWRSFVIGTARARLWRRIRKAWRPPFAIGADCAWWFSEHESPAELAAELGFELSDQLGKFKPAGTTSGADACAITSAGEPVWRVVNELREVSR